MTRQDKYISTCLAIIILCAVVAALAGCRGGEHIEKIDEMYNGIYGMAQPTTPTQARAAQWPNETDHEWRLRTGHTRIRRINEDLVRAQP